MGDLAMYDRCSIMLCGCGFTFPPIPFENALVVIAILFIEQFWHATYNKYFKNHCLDQLMANNVLYNQT